MSALLMHANTMEEIRPLDNDSRRAVWAGKFYGMGLHREPVAECYNPPESEPRVRGYVDGQVEHVSNAYKLEDV